MASRLLVICNDYDYFVAHRYRALETLPEQGVRVLALCGGTNRVSRNLSFPVRPVACHRYALSPLSDMLFVLQVLWRLVRFRPDVVHTITLKPNLFAGLAVRLYNLLPGRPSRLVMMAPGLGRVFAEDDGNRGAGRRRLVAGALRLALSGSRSTVLFENPADRQTWEAAGIMAPDRGRVVSGAGVDPDEFALSPAPRQDLRLTVLFASRLLKSKGVEDLLVLAERLARRQAPVRFLVAGGYDRSDDDAVDLSARPLPANLTFLGRRDDVPRLLAEADVVLLLTTYQEGLPRILLEGAAMRCALVATDMPGCRRIVESGRTGFLVPVDGRTVDLDHAERVINDLARDRAAVRRMGDEAYEAFWRKGFDLASVRREMAEALFPFGELGEAAL